MMCENLAARGQPGKRRKAIAKKEDPRTGIADEHLRSLSMSLIISSSTGFSSFAVLTMLLRTSKHAPITPSGNAFYYNWKKRPLSIKKGNSFDETGKETAKARTAEAMRANIRWNEAKERANAMKPT